MFSSYSGNVDRIFLIIAGISVCLLLLITIVMIYFVIKYHHTRNPESVEIPGNIFLEILWIIIPTAIVLLMFFEGSEGFKLMRKIPSNAMEIEVTGRMWDWSFKYFNGKSTKQLYVPVGKPVKLKLHSLDVIHSFYIPSFRIKEDVVPGKENYLWFKPESEGPADIFCAEFCGQNHSYMMSKVIVMSQKEFDDWYNGNQPKKSTKAESDVLKKIDAVGCLSGGCHTLEAPLKGSLSFRGIFSKSRTVIFKGEEKTVIADENYIKKSIEIPGEEILKGHENIMPDATELGLSEPDIKLIIQFIKGL